MEMRLDYLKTICKSLAAAREAGSTDALREMMKEYDNEQLDLIDLTFYRKIAYLLINSYVSRDPFVLTEDTESIHEYCILGVGEKVRQERGKKLLYLMEIMAKLNWDMRVFNDVLEKAFVTGMVEERAGGYLSIILEILLRGGEKVYFDTEFLQMIFSLKNSDTELEPILNILLTRNFVCFGEIDKNTLYQTLKSSKNYNILEKFLLRNVEKIT